MRNPACLFSIIVPTYARPRQLRGCLASLAGLDYPASGYEVVVVDDGSPEPLDGVVAPFRARLNLTLVRQANRGPAAARNAGAAAAKGRFLAFTDDDCRPAADWLRRLEARLAGVPDRLIGGRTVNALTRNPYAVASQLIVDAVYAFYNRDPDAARFFASNNMALAADLFQALGGFDSSFPKAAAEDRDLCDRWLHHGYKLEYAPEAVVLHAHPLTLLRFCKQHFAYGRGARRYHQLRTARGSGRLSHDLAFHAQLPALLQAPLAGLPLGRAVPVVALLGLWQAANAAGFFYEAYRAWRSARHAPRKAGRLTPPARGVSAAELAERTEHQAALVAVGDRPWDIPNARNWMR
jgi:glycosyltransferase involved in cell wall biosynthesis